MSQDLCHVPASLKQRVSRLRNQRVVDSNVEHQHFRGHTAWEHLNSLCTTAGAVSLAAAPFRKSFEDFILERLGSFQCFAVGLPQNIWPGGLCLGGQPGLEHHGPHLGARQRLSNRTRLAARPSVFVGAKLGLFYAFLMDFGRKAGWMGQPFWASAFFGVSWHDLKTFDLFNAL